MRGSVATVICFVAGCVAGAMLGDNASWLSEASLWLLYLLMFQAGMGIGTNRRLREMLSQVGLGTLLLPVAIVGGAVVMSAAGALLLSWSAPECMAAGSAVGYYSLASILIGSLAEPSIGVVLASELATVALLANILRELFALVAAPVIARRLGPEALIACAGVTSIDVCLPAIRRCCGEAYVPAAIISGALIDVASPFVISFFCSLI